MSADLPSLLYLFGRFLLGGLYVAGGVEHFFALPVLAGIMAARGVPAARTSLILGSVWQLLVFGVWLAPSALALVVFTLIASVICLNFWDKPEPDRTAQRNSFLANIAIVGALLMVAAQAL